ncbi:hypothetical protein J2848_005661 [Azospirillum lipoferum]|nr:hypothetical protein [Azospirillum lipoferum]
MAFFLARIFDNKRFVPRSVLDGSTPFPDMGVPGCMAH